MVAYALAGTMAIDFEEEPLGEEKAGPKLLLLAFELIFSNSGFCSRQIQVLICIDLIHVLSVVCVCVL